MTLQTLLLERYAVLKQLSERSVIVYDVTLRWFDRYLAGLADRPPGPATLDDLDDLTVAGFLRWRAAQSTRRGRVSPSTVAKDRVQLCSLWGFAARKRLRNSRGEPLEFPGLPQSRTIQRTPVAYTVDEIRQLIRAARLRRGVTGPVPSAWWWSTILAAAFVTGERIGALRQLRWKDVDLAGRRILFRAETRKGARRDESRRISVELARELAAHAGPPDTLVWPWPGHPLSIFPSLKLLAKRAGVIPRGFHGLRRASASYVAAAGGDASAHLGHSDPTIAREHYLDPRITGERSGIDFLPPLEDPPAA